MQWAEEFFKCRVGRVSRDPPVCETMVGLAELDPTYYSRSCYDSVADATIKDCRQRVRLIYFRNLEIVLGTKRSGKGRRKQGRKKRRMRAKIRHRKK
jgi:hypothetical protein